jgi:hypothetical protein
MRLTERYTRTGANTSTGTKPLVANNYGIWTISNYRGYESWNAGPTHPQTTVADGASMIPSPPGSHFGGPSMVFTGNMDKAFGPILTYFNKAERGGHFAAWEEPELFSSEVRAAFESVR